MDISWWELDGTEWTADGLREHLREGAAEAWADVPGLRLKCWVADRRRNLWGAVMLWEADCPPVEVLPPNRAAELIGRPPTHRLRFEVEAAVEGNYDLADLHGLGPALAS